MSLRRPNNRQHDYVLFSQKVIPNPSDFGLSKYKKTKVDPSLMAIRPAAKFMLGDTQEMINLQSICNSNYVYGTYDITKEELMFNLGMLNNVGSFLLYDYSELIKYSHAMSFVIFSRYGMYSCRQTPIIPASEVEQELITKIVLSDKTDVPGVLMHKK